MGPLEALWTVYSNTLVTIQYNVSSSAFGSSDSMSGQSSSLWDPKGLQSYCSMLSGERTGFISGVSGQWYQFVPSTISRQSWSSSFVTLPSGTRGCSQGGKSWKALLSYTRTEVGVWEILPHVVSCTRRPSFSLGSVHIWLLMYHLKRAIVPSSSITGRNSPSDPLERAWLLSFWAFSSTFPIKRMRLLPFLLSFFPPVLGAFLLPHSH